MQKVKKKKIWTHEGPSTKNKKNKWAHEGSCIEKKRERKRKIAMFQNSKL
jgi:hypothetical protein